MVWKQLSALLGGSQSHPEAALRAFGKSCSTHFKGRLAPALRQRCILDKRAAAGVDLIFTALLADAQPALAEQLALADDATAPARRRISGLRVSSCFAEVLAALLAAPDRARDAPITDLELCAALIEGAIAEQPPALRFAAGIEHATLGAAAARYFRARSLADDDPTRALELVSVDGDGAHDRWLERPELAGALHEQRARLEANRAASAVMSDLAAASDLYEAALDRPQSLESAPRRARLRRRLIENALLCGDPERARRALAIPSEELDDPEVEAEVTLLERHPCEESARASAHRGRLALRAMRAASERADDELESPERSDRAWALCAEARSEASAAFRVAAEGGDPRARLSLARLATLNEEQVSFGAGFAKPEALAALAGARAVAPELWLFDYLEARVTLHDPETGELVALDSADAERALALLRRASDDGSPEVLNQAAALALDRAALAGQADGYAEAIALFEALTAKQPDDPVAPRGLCLALLGAGRSECALEAIDAALERSPESTDLWVQRSRCATRLERGSEARAALERALELDSRHPEALMLLVDLAPGEGPS